MEYNLVVIMTKLQLHPTILMNLTNIKLNESSQDTKENTLKDSIP